MRVSSGVVYFCVARKYRGLCLVFQIFRVFSLGSIGTYVGISRQYFGSAARHSTYAELIRIHTPRGPRGRHIVAILRHILGPAPHVTITF